MLLNCFPGSVPALGDVARVAADGRHAVLAHARALAAAGIARTGQLLQAGGICIKIDLPGKSILRDYFKRI